MSTDLPTLYDAANLYKLSYVKDILEFHAIRLRKSLGQSFLFDRNGIDMIVRAAQLGPDDVVLEVGPGMGHLTYALLQRAKHVIAVELDQRFLPILKGLLGGFENFTLVHADILKVDLAARCAELGIKPTVIVANVPYYITTPILTHVVESGLALRSATFTIQREVAERYIAEPGGKDYSSISIVVKYWGDARIAGFLGPRSFFPRPKVESAILRIDMHSTPPVGVASEELFYKIVRTAFQQRRKKLRNSLKWLIVEGYPLDAALAAAAIDGGRRPETLTLEEYARLADALITEEVPGTE
jgi:16S rRNA (adenine1518-N6/adenine1519-N6)-dimethyltransferase